MLGALGCPAEFKRSLMAARVRGDSLLHGAKSKLYSSGGDALKSFQGTASVEQFSVGASVERPRTPQWVTAERVRHDIANVRVVDESGPGRCRRESSSATGRCCGESRRRCPA